MGTTTQEVRRLQALPGREMGETLEDMEKEDDDNYCHLLADSIEVEFKSPQEYIHFARNAFNGILKYMGVDMAVVSKRAEIAMKNSPYNPKNTFLDYWYPKYTDKEMKKHFVKVEDRPPNEAAGPEYKDGGTFFLKRGEIVGFISALVTPLVVTPTRQHYCRTNIKVGGAERFITNG